MKFVNPFVSLIAFATFISPLAAQEKKAPPPPPPAEEEEIDVPPPAVGGAAGSRSGGISRAGGEKHPSIFVIGPVKKGATAQASPVLYWYLSDDTEHPIDITLVQNRGPTLLRKSLEGAKAGLKKIDLSQESTSDSKAPVILQPETDYRLTVRIRPAADNAEENPDFRGRGNNVTSTMWIWRVKADGKEPPISEKSNPRSLAKRGLWFDTFAALCAQIEANPANPTPHKQRLSMLKKEKVFELESDGDQRASRGETRLRGFVEREAVTPQN